MINYIPRLEWNDLSGEGVMTLGSPTITLSGSISGLNEGMIISHPNFPEGTEILSIVGLTVTASANATGSGTDMIEFFERLDFDYPPEKDDGEQFKVNESISESVGGIRQTQVNSITAERPIRFSFISRSIRDRLMEEFYLTWAVYGKEFRFFESKSEPEYKTYQLDKLDGKQSRDIPKGEDFLYSHPFTFRRVVL